MSSVTFEVGSTIRWVEDYIIGDDVEYIYAKGIIKAFTPYTVVIDIARSTLRKGTIRVNKRNLAYDVHDEELAQIIMATDGISTKSEKPPKLANVEKPAKPEKPIPHKVYGLKDPLDDSIHYVGISKNVELRFKQHIQCQGLNLELHIWIQGLLKQGLLPILVIFEDEVIGHRVAREREKFWIQHYQNINAPLTNIASVSQSGEAEE